MTTDNKPDIRTRYIGEILPLLLERGVKNLTMDAVAKHLSISKRTLYEIFDSKETLLLEVISHMQREHAERLRRETASATNAMEGMALALRCHRSILSQMDISLIRDIDESFPHIKHLFKIGTSRTYVMLLKAFETGVEQGVFRRTVDYRIILRLFLIQMESLKRMEEYFPSDVTLDQAISTISVGLLRSIATPKGMEIIDRIYAEITNPYDSSQPSDKNLRSDKKQSLP